MMIKRVLQGFIIFMWCFVSTFCLAEDMYIAIEKGDIEQVKNIISINSNAVNMLPDKEYGPTLLHRAIQTGQREIAILLINNGAKVNEKIYLGVTPLWYAADMGMYDVAELLIKNGADINAENDCGETPLDQAIFAKLSTPDDSSLSAVVDLLISYGARMGSKNNEKLLYVSRNLE